MIYFLVVIVMALSAAVGKMISNSIEKRDRFFSDMLDFLDFLMNNIKFSKTIISDIFDEFIKEKNSAFAELLLLLKKINLGESEADVAFNKKTYFLKKEEKEKLKNFAKSLGGGDENSQLNIIQNFKTYISSKQIQSSEARQTNQPLCMKLSLAVGAVICILII